VNNAAVCRDCGLERERSVVSAPEPSQAAATPVAAAAAAPERETLSRLCPNCSEKTLVERTSTKEPNAGRKFVSCLRDCGLFEWGDAEAYACPKCGCNRDTVKRAVKKEGRNHGRIFFGCATFPGGCGFFQWTEEFEKELECEQEREEEFERKEDDESLIDQGICPDCRGRFGKIPVDDGKRMYVCTDCGRDPEGNAHKI
jgi:ssDNA-binding Zn-finger/Zn-ribbon topoisomerase 1